MPSLSFQAQFRQPIVDGLKRHTLRDNDQRFTVGKPLYLFTGMRTKQCKRIGNATCTGILPIRLDFEHRRVEFASGHAITTPADTDAFAQGDGFPGGWREMEAFWKKHHPKITVWSGFMIQWGETLVVTP